MHGQNRKQYICFYLNGGELSPTFDLELSTLGVQNDMYAYHLQENE